MSEKTISLLQFNHRLQDAVADADLQNCWVIAETSDVSVRRGHCYMELIQKDPDTGATVAKLGAVIWANVFQYVDGKFFAVTGQHFGNGMKVMLNMSANFHVQYGFKAVVSDVNPEYTLGDMARRRIEIINRLTREGVIDMNKELPMPEMPQRIAVISSPNAAGYGDFINQLENNPYGVKFYTCLFEAMMQGDDTAPTVISALNRVARHEDAFDCVVIIRGGGSTSDLNAFDDYDLALNVAQFPLPVVVGIGHERDTTVLDYVAALPVKTPTAAAEFFVKCGAQALATLQQHASAISLTVREMIAQAQKQLAYSSSMIPALARRVTDNARLRLHNTAHSVPLIVGKRSAEERTRLSSAQDAIKTAVNVAMMRERQRLEALADKVQILSPQNTLNRGYSLTLKDGKAVTDATQLTPGDKVTTRFKTGEATFVMKN